MDLVLALPAYSVADLTPTSFPEEMSCGDGLLAGLEKKKHENILES